MRPSCSWRAVSILSGRHSATGEGCRKGACGWAGINEALPLVRAQRVSPLSTSSAPLAHRVASGLVHLATKDPESMGVSLYEG